MTFQVPLHQDHLPSSLWNTNDCLVCLIKIRVLGVVVVVVVVVAHQVQHVLCTVGLGRKSYYSINIKQVINPERQVLHYPSNQTSPEIIINGR
jgi:hypothetical protein